MEFLYEVKNQEAVLWRLYDYGTEATLPETIDGYPLTELAPYAFSQHLDPQAIAQGLASGQLRTNQDCGGKPQEPALTGARLSALKLPAALRRIGAYAFYNCSALEKLSFHSGLADLGAGLFTGCHRIRELELFLDGSAASCLREVLIEIPEKLAVTLHGQEEARLIFPEYFEESVENTPARILMTRMHGSGMSYRNCFSGRSFDFHAYDSCFYRACASEDLETVLAMALGRLRYPAKLTEAARADYEGWLTAHLEEVCTQVVAAQDLETLEYLADRASAELLGRMAREAAARNFPEGAALLMDARYARERVGRQAAGAIAPQKQAAKAAADRFAL